MLIYTRQSSGRKKPSKKSVRLQQERKDFFAAILSNKKIKRPSNMPDLSCESKAAPLSNNIHTSGGFKKSVDDYKWKKDKVESAETIKEIERKKTRIAPGWNKGATMYITDETDPVSLGRKV